MRNLVILAALTLTASACAKAEKVPERKKAPVAAPQAPAGTSGTGTASGTASTAEDAGSGTGTASDLAPVLPPAEPPAPAPASLGEFAIEAVPAFTGQLAFKLTWAAATDAATYDVTIAPDAKCVAPTPTYPGVAALQDRRLDGRHEPRRRPQGRNERRQQPERVDLPRDDALFRRGRPGGRRRQGRRAMEERRLHRRHRSGQGPRRGGRGQQSPRPDRRRRPDLLRRDERRRQFRALGFGLVFFQGTTAEKGTELYNYAPAPD